MLPAYRTTLSPFFNNNQNDSDHACRVDGASFGLRLVRFVLVIKNSLGRSVQILVLPILQRPKKQDQACQAEG